jgi:hypothetical protein
VTTPAALRIPTPREVTHRCRLLLASIANCLTAAASRRNFEVVPPWRSLATLRAATRHTDTPSSCRYNSPARTANFAQTDCPRRLETAQGHSIPRDACFPRRMRSTCAAARVRARPRELSVNNSQHVLTSGEWLHVVVAARCVTCMRPHRRTDTQPDSSTSATARRVCPI